MPRCAPFPCHLLRRTSTTTTHSLSPSPLISYYIHMFPHPSSITLHYRHSHQPRSSLHHSHHHSRSRLSPPCLNALSRPIFSLSLSILFNFTFLSKPILFARLYSFLAICRFPPMDTSNVPFLLILSSRQSTVSQSAVSRVSHSYPHVRVIHVFVRSYYCRSRRWKCFICVCICLQLP